MNQRACLALFLGMATFAGTMSFDELVRGDDTEDITSNLRDFEANQRKQVEEAIAEVSSQLGQQQQALAALQEQIGKSQAALERLQAIRVAFAAVDEPQPIASSAPRSEQTGDSVRANLPPIPSRTTPQPVRLVSASIPVRATPAPSLQAIEPHRCPVDGPSCRFEEGLTDAGTDEIQIMASPGGSLRLITRVRGESSKEQVQEILCSSLTLRDARHPGFDAASHIGHIDLERGEVPATKSGDGQAELAQILDQLRELIGTASHAAPPPIPAPVLASPGTVDENR